MAKSIAVLPEVKAQVSDGDNLEDCCFWDITAQSVTNLPTFRTKPLFSSTGRILEEAVSSKHR